MRTNSSLSAVLRIGFLSIFFLSSLLGGGMSTASSQTDGGEWQLVSQFGGSLQALAVSGKTAYAGIGLRLNAIDLTDPAQPKLLGMSPVFNDTVQDVVVSGRTTYVAAGSAGLVILDVSDPRKPTTLGVWDASGFVEGVAVMGRFLFLANGPKGLSVLDVSNPSAPVEIASTYSTHYLFDVICFGNQAYLAAGESGLLVVDIKDPAKPRELAQLNTYGYTYEVARAERYIYLADAWEGVQVVDVSDPAEPVQVATAPTSGWSLGVAVLGDQLASANGALGVDLFNIADPTQPKLAGSYLKESNEGDTSVRRVVLTNDCAYLVDTLNGLRVLDISIPAQPTHKGLFSQLAYARRVLVKGDHAYVATGSEGAMYVINIADPLHPYQVSKFMADGISVDVVLNGDYATIGTFEDSSNCYTVVDVGDPADPGEASAISLYSLECGAARQMAAQGDFVYSADEAGLSIYDLSDPARIRTAGRIDLQQEGHQTVALAVSGEHAYVADAGAGLKIVDISDPGSPKLLHKVMIENVVGSVAIEGTRLYVGHYGDGFTVMDNSSPGDIPVAIGRYHTASTLEEAFVSNGLLISSEGSGGLEILDVTDPADIRLLQSISTPGFAWASVLSGEYIYTANSEAGLLIYQKVPAGQSDPSASSGVQPEYPVSKTASIQKGSGAEVPRFPEDEQMVTSSKSCVVNSTTDGGEGSLRACLEQPPAGLTVTFDPAVFNPRQPAIINLESELPALEVGSITIDASNAGVILDGRQQVPVGLKISSAYNTVMGIEFVNFPMDGITLDFPSQYNQIGGDHFIGSGPSGQGNAFSGCQNGIRILFAQHNVVKGNFVGTNASGTQAKAPNSIGIVINNYATYNWIGGAGVGEKNIISNNDRGVDIASNSASYNTVAGNYIGTDVTGTRAIPNTSWGVLIEVGGRNNIIGGTTPEERNIISGNMDGVSISDYGSTQNSVIGNYIGLDVSGTKALPNMHGGGIFQSMYNRFGGTRPGEANIISGNSQGGMRFFGMGSVHAILLGNIIGLDAEGQQPVPNSTGVRIDGGRHSLVGGASQDAANQFSNNGLGIQIEYTGTSNNWVTGNIITNSSQAGIMIQNGASENFIVGNTISRSQFGIVVSQSVKNTLHGNSISASTDLGIDIHEGNHRAVTAPVLEVATVAGVSGITCPFCTVELFSDPADEGLTYEGSITADAAGRFTYTGQIEGPHVTATTTDLYGSTSVFSRYLQVSAGN